MSPVFLKAEVELTLSFNFKDLEEDPKEDGYVHDTFVIRQ